MEVHQKILLEWVDKKITPVSKRIQTQDLWGRGNRPKDYIGLQGGEGGQENPQNGLHNC